MSGVVSDLQIRIGESKAQIEISDLPTIEADPTLIRQLLQNLVSNALKFSRKDVAPVIKVATGVRCAPDGSERRRANRLARWPRMLRLPR